MGINQRQIVEERCDRCEFLIAVRSLDGDGNVVEEDVRGVNTGEFKLFQVGNEDEPLVDYDVLCDRCRKVMDTLIEKMGKVNRGKRKRKAKEPKEMPTPEKKKVAKKKK